MSIWRYINIDDFSLILPCSIYSTGIAFAAELAASIENYTLVCFVRHYELDNQGQRDGRYTIVKAYTTEELPSVPKTTEPNHHPPTALPPHSQTKIDLQPTAESSTKDQYDPSSMTRVKRSLTFDDPAPTGNSKHADNVEAPDLSLPKSKCIKEILQLGNADIVFLGSVPLS